MAAAKYLRIRNWDNYQHYKTGRHAQGPLTWIKLHTSMLLDFELTSLSIEAQLLADRLLLVAGMTGNSLANDEKWLESACKVPSKCVQIGLPELRAIGFVEPKTVYTASRHSLDQSREEKSREEERREEILHPVDNSVENLNKLRALTGGLLKDINAA